MTGLGSPVVPEIDKIPTRDATLTEATLEIRRLTIQRCHGRLLQDLVTDLNLSVKPREIVGLVGESGSGKSLTALACVRLLPNLVRVITGDILLNGTSIMSLDKKAMRSVRGSHIGMVFQDPLTSLDPCFRVGDQLVETVRAHSSVSRKQARSMALELLDRVGIPRPRERMRAYPHELSGGMRQRVGIASALIMRPNLLLADEPTTALDVSTQASILALVRELRGEIGMSVLWISHDLAVVGQIADRVAVMYCGEIVEAGTAEEIFTNPRHPYTCGLVVSARRRPRGSSFGYIPGVVAAPGRWDTGCRFRPRCERVTQICQIHPSLRESNSSALRCYHPVEMCEERAGG